MMILIIIIIITITILFLTYINMALLTVSLNSSFPPNTNIITNYNESDSKIQLNLLPFPIGIFEHNSQHINSSKIFTYILNVYLFLNQLLNNLARKAPYGFSMHVPTQLFFLQ